MLAFPLFLLARTRRDRQADVSGRRNRRARKAAEKRLRQAKALATKGDRKAFYDELVRAVLGYLVDKFGIAPGDLNREEIRRKLEEHHLPMAKID